MDDHAIQRQMLVEQRVANDGPNAAVAYLLWLFLGAFSAHRFYLGRPGSAICQVLLNCLLIGLVWTFFDVFMIAGMLRTARDGVRRSATDELSRGSGAGRREPRLATR